jgi:protein tyrosine phosphatase (PTP) superfamily phosphohydrolase (DUF442 family)
MDSVVLENSRAGSPASPSARPAKPARRKTLQYLAFALILGVLGVFGWEAYYVFLGPNFHCVTPADAYRSGQPKADWLEQVVDEHGIRTVINLRGDGHESAWYVNERRVADERGLAFENVMLSASFAPQPRDLQRLLTVLDDAPRPVLFHCRSGGDRSGLVAALYLLLYTETPLDKARGQLSLRYGHYAYGRSACLHGVLDQYEQWLAGEDLEHRPEHLRHWITHFYRRPA